jgi:hypothetical protein
MTSVSKMHGIRHLSHQFARSLPVTAGIVTCYVSALFD